MTIIIIIPHTHTVPFAAAYTERKEIVVVALTPAVIVLSTVNTHTHTRTRQKKMTGAMQHEYTHGSDLAEHRLGRVELFREHVASHVEGQILIVNL